MVNLDSSLYIQETKNTSPIDATKAPQIQTSPSVAGMHKLQMLSNSASMVRDTVRKGYRLEDEARDIGLKIDQINTQKYANDQQLLLKGLTLARDTYLKYEETQAQELLNQYQEDLTEATANQLMNLTIKPSDTLETILKKVQAPYKEIEASYKDILFSTYTPATAKKIWRQMQQIGSQVSNNRLLQTASKIKSEREALGILGISSKITKEYVAGLEDLIEKGASEEVIDKYTANFNKQIQQKVADGVIPINLATHLRDTLGYHRQYHKNFGDVLAHTSNSLSLASSIKELNKLPANIRQEKLLKLIGSKAFKALPQAERRKYLRQISNSLKKVKGELYTKASTNIASQMAYAIANGQLDSIPDKAWKLVASSKKTSTSFSKMLSTAMSLYMSNNPDATLDEIKTYYSKVKNKLITYYGKSKKTDIYKTLLYFDKSFASNVKNKVNTVKDLLEQVRRDGILDASEAQRLEKYKRFLPEDLRKSVDMVNNVSSFIEKSINNLDNLPDYEFKQLVSILNNRELRKIVGDSIVRKASNTIQQAILTNNPTNVYKLFKKINQAPALQKQLYYAVKGMDDKYLIPTIDYAEKIKKTNPTVYRTIKSSIGVKRYNKISSILHIMGEKGVPYIDAVDIYETVKVRPDDIVAFSRKYNVSYKDAERYIREAKITGVTPEKLLEEHTETLSNGIRLDIDKLPPSFVKKIKDVVDINKRKIPQSAKQAHLVESNKGDIVIFTNEVGVPLSDPKNPKNPLHFKVDLEHSDPDITTKTIHLLNETKKSANKALKKINKIINDIVNNKTFNTKDEDKDTTFVIPKLPKNKSIDTTSLKINKELNNE